MKLNLGSGNDYKEGWVNVDSGQCKCDVQHDLEQFPWPFPDSSVDFILLQHILEHISKENFVAFVREMYRVCKDGAAIEVFSPYAGSDNFWTDPTHKLPLTVRTFDYFDDAKPLRENGLIYGWGDVSFNVKAELLNNPPNGPDVHYHMVVNKKQIAQTRPRFTYYTIIGKDESLLAGHLDNVVNHAGFGALTCDKELIVIIYRNSSIPREVSEKLAATSRKYGARVVFFDEPTKVFIDNLYHCWNLGYQESQSGYVFRGGSDQVFSKNSFLSLYTVAEELRKVEPSFPFVLQANTIENSKRALDSRHLSADFGQSFDDLDMGLFEAVCEKLIEPVPEALLTLDQSLHYYGKPSPFDSSLGRINRTDGCSWLMTKQAWEKFGPLPVVENNITGDVIIHDRMQTAGYQNFIVRDCVTYHFVRGESLQQYS